MHLAVDFHLIVGDEGEIDHAQTAHNAETRIQIRHLENCYKYEKFYLEKVRMLNCVILLQYR